MTGLTRIDEIDPAGVPAHIGVVMDGNGRWAQKRGLQRTDGQSSPVSRRYVLVIEGELPADEGSGRIGFFVSMHVVADSVAEGLNFAHRFVPDAARPGLSVADVNDEQPAAGELKGVYWCGLLHSFDPDAPQENQEDDDD